jgi:mono/diheme cytochrome c family protein/plastocyanin
MTRSPVAYFHFCILMLILFLLPAGNGRYSLHAEERPVKEFSMTVQEITITLLEDPEKKMTVWAYALEGEQPSVPGPEIRVNKGDRVRVHFHNTHDLPHTIHFHGVHPFNMDGNGQRAMGKEQVQMPGESYTYEWVAEDPGFYFYHCHFDTVKHVDHGMYGLFVVEDPAWPRADRELVTMWDEWDTTGDGQYDTHTINSRSAPNHHSLQAGVGETVRLILANIGYEFHTPHLHGQKWIEVNAGNLRSPVSENPNGVLSIGPAEIKVVEFVPEYTGTWLFHCHVLPHVANDGEYFRGMLTVLKITDSQSPESPQSGIDQNTKGGKAPTSDDSKVASIQDLPLSDYPRGVAERGDAIYNKHCQSCHGNLAKGGYGPGLRENSILQKNEKFWKIVLKGQGNMPSWEERLSTQDIADVQAYLKTLKPPPPP